MATLGTRIRDAASAARERLARLQPGRVAAPYRVVVVACWIVAALLAAAILVPVLTAGIQAEQVGTTGPVGRFRAPLGVRLLLAGSGAVLAGVLVIVLLLRERMRPRGRIARELGMVAAAGFPVLGLAADRQWVAAVAALVLVGVAELAAHRPLTAHPGGTALVGLLAGSPWLVLLVVQAGTPADGAGSWVWLALFGFAAAFAAFGTYYGVARAATSRSRLLAPLFRDDAPAVVALGLVLLVLAVVVLRLTVLRNLFADPDPQLWAPFAASPASWVHAGLVAALVVAVAAASVRRPLRRSGESRVIAGLAIAGNTDLVLSGVVILVGMLVAAAGAGTLLPDPGPVVVAALKVAGVLAIVVAVLLPALRGTAARAIGLWDPLESTCRHASLSIL